MFEVEGFGFCEMCDQTVEGESDGVQADMPALRQWGTHLDDAPFRRHRGVALRGMSADSHTRGLGAMTDNRTNEPTEAMILAGLNAYSSKGQDS